MTGTSASSDRGRMRWQYNLHSAKLRGGEVHRVIEKTQCGICIPGGDAMLARAIAQLFADRANLQAFGINRRRAVEEFYSRKVCTKQLESQVTLLD